MITYHLIVIDILRKLKLSPAQAPAVAKDYEAPKPVPSIEQRREWAHGDGGKGEQCGRANKPIYTQPNGTPGTCREYSCDNGTWESKGIIQREKGSKKILTRDGKKVE